MTKKSLLNFLFTLITYLVLLKPTYIVSINIPFFGISVNNVFYFIQLILVIFFVIIKVTSSYIKKIDIIIVFILISTALSNLKNGYSISLALLNYINLLISYLFFDYELKNNKNEFIKNSVIIFVILLIINYISILIKPVNYFDQSTRIHFLGYDNDVVPIIFTFLLFFILNIYIKNGMNIISYLGIVIGFFTLEKIWSANGIIGLIILLIYLVFFRKSNTNNIFNFKNIFILSLIVFFAIVIFRIQNHFEYIIVNMLNRDITFTGRTNIWDNAITAWKQHKFLGVGTFDFVQRSKIYGVYHAHCTYLNILFEVGIIGFLTRLCLFKEINNVLKKHRTKISALVVCFFAIYFIITTIEVYVNDFLFYVLISLSLNLDVFNNRGDINES